MKNYTNFFILLLYCNYSYGIFDIKDNISPLEDAQNVYNYFYKGGEYKITTFSLIIDTIGLGAGFYILDTSCIKLEHRMPYKFIEGSVSYLFSKLVRLIIMDTFPNFIVQTITSVAFCCLIMYGLRYCYIHFVGDFTDQYYYHSTIKKYLLFKQEVSGEREDKFSEQKRKDIYVLSIPFIFLIGGILLKNEGIGNEVSHIDLSSLREDDLPNRYTASENGYITRYTGSELDASTITGMRMKVDRIISETGDPLGNSELSNNLFQLFKEIKEQKIISKMKRLEKSSSETCNTIDDEIRRIHRERRLERIEEANDTRVKKLIGELERIEIMAIRTLEGLKRYQKSIESYRKKILELFRMSIYIQDRLLYIFPDMKSLEDQDFLNGLKTHDDISIRRYAKKIETIALLKRKLEVHISNFEAFGINDIVLKVSAFLEGISERIKLNKNGGQKKVSIPPNRQPGVAVYNFQPGSAV